MNGFSDYHYNEAYRDGGGYICPAQVLSMSFNESDMIFVKMFTLADFGPIIFYPKARNSRLVLLVLLLLLVLLVTNIMSVSF